MERTLTIGFVWVVLLGATGSALAAEVYKWKDGNSVTTYSQLPPARGVRSERIRTAGGGARRVDPAPATAPGTTGVANGRNGNAPAETDQQRALREQLNREEQTRLANVAATRQAECTKARGQFDQLTQYARMRVQDAAGNVRVMPEQERQQLIQETKGRIVEFCSS